MRADLTPLAAEAQRLAQALSGWLESRTPPSGERRTDSTHAGDWATSDGAAHRPASCEICPVCQLIAITRGEKSEVLHKLVDAGTAALSALAGLVETHLTTDAADPGGTPESGGTSEPGGTVDPGGTVEPGTSGPVGTPDPAATSDPEPPPLRVQRIRIQ